MNLRIPSLDLALAAGLRSMAVVDTETGEIRHLLATGYRDCTPYLASGSVAAEVAQDQGIAPFQATSARDSLSTAIGPASVPQDHLFATKGEAPFCKPPR